MKKLKLPPEEWKLVPRLPFEFDGDIECSNWGRVRKISTNSIFKGSRRGNNEGWYAVHLFKKHKRRTVASALVVVHRMVWELFGERPLLPHEHLFHINKCQDDNYIWNLAPTNKRFHKRRVKRWKKEGKYYHKRGRRYFHQRH